MKDRQLASLAQILAKDAGIKITVGGDKAYITQDRSRINIGRVEGTPHAAAVMTGYVFHEVGHYHFTDFAVVKTPGMEGTLLNIVEDVRIEDLAIKERPGAAISLSHVVRWMNAEFMDSYTGELDIALAIKAFTSAKGRHFVLNQPGAKEVYGLAKAHIFAQFGQVFLDDLEMVTDGMEKLKTTQASLKMAQAIIELLKQEMSDLPEEEGEGDGGESSEEGGDADGKTGNGNTPQEDDSREEKESKQNPSRNGGTEENSSEDDQKSQKSGNTPKKKSLSKKDLQDILDNEETNFDVGKMAEEELNKLAEEAVENGIQRQIPMLPDVKRQGRPGSGIWIDTAQAVATTSQLSQRLRTLLIAKRREPVSWGARGKKFSTKRYVKCVTTGDPTVFKKKTPTDRTNTAVVILLDLSSSMNGEPAQMARNATYALHKALSGIEGVSACSMQYKLASRDPDITILSGFGEKPNAERFRVGSAGTTPTTEALWAARAALINRPEERKIVFCMTDGHPDNILETKGALERLSKDGIQNIGVGIMHESVKSLWENHVVINDLSELAPGLFKTMQDALN